MIYRAPAPAPIPPPVPAEPEPEPEPPREIFTLSVDGKTHELLKERVVLGRSRDADIRVADLNVSRKHAEVRQRGDECVVVDLGSTNGTLVNGKRVERARLREGDVITLGSTDVVVGRSQT
jgi:predicted component of type VI protein secretion system